MPIIFKESKDTQIEDEFKDGMDKLFFEYPLKDFDCSQNTYWVYGIFNERIVGAMLVETINKQQVLAHYLAVRKATQNRGVGREIINRWSKINNIEVRYSEKLKMVIGEFR
ncbi:acetyl-CoA sensor PanZ family protein [Marinicellulosiphila megalodicopiae]|uniref:acetyl-CoA sensor PanZ family protein n=1 Tax=Marinicellulosiphila megalodicopiae TaxID=2724896 RepID=UPI003BB09544